MALSVNYPTVGMTTAGGIWIRWGDVMPSELAQQGDTSPERKRDETITFVFLAVLLAPALSVIFVGGYGFLVWMQHLIFGPPAV